MQRLSPPTLRIKAYGDQEVKVLGYIVLYMHASEKTDRVTWQVMNTTGVPILGRTQAKHMNYVSYPDTCTSLTEQSQVYRLRAQS